MKIKTGLILVIAAFLIFISVNLIFSQESTEQTGSIPQTQNEPDTQWVWGEVVTLDAQGKTLLLKYLDYETDQEKEINIATDDKTTFENIKSIDQIRLKDILSIDYIVSASGENIAKNISVEKPEDIEGVKEGGIQEGQKIEEQELPPPTQEEPKQEESNSPGY